MPVEDRYVRLPIGEIKVNRDTRQRREIEVKDLMEDIRLRGVLSPILVHQEFDGGYTLVFGERRLTASKELGLPDIPARLSNGLSPQELEIIELEENIKRSDLPWIDIVRSVERIHQLHVGLDPGWMQKETAEVCGLHFATVSKYLSIASQLGNEYVAGAGTADGAWNILLRKQKREEGDAIAELLEGGLGFQPLTTIADAEAMQNLPEGSRAATIEAIPWMGPLGEILPGDRQPPLPGFVLDSILNVDFTEWVRGYEGKKFNLLHIDFPYGVNLFSSNGLRTGPQRSQMGQDEGTAYEDDQDVYRSLVESLATNLDRILSVSSHIMFWFANKFEIEQWTRETFARLAPSVSWNRFPLIWLKSDNAGIAAAPNYEPRHIYETCLVGSRGKRQIVKLVSDAYAAPTDKSIHSSAKPEPMLRHFMQMFVDENTSMLDPTCGSGTALRAAESLGAKFVLGLERDAKMVELALGALRVERVKRGAARRIG